VASPGLELGGLRPEEFQPPCIRYDLPVKIGSANE
jgi:hypothetical protein